MAYTIAKTITALLVVVIAVAVLASGYTQVEAGHRGVKTTQGKVDMSQSLDEGGYIIMPIFEKIHPMSIQTLKYVSNVGSASKDLQAVQTEASVNHRLVPADVNVVYKELGTSYEDTIINPVVSEAIKQATAKYNAEELITKRPQVKAEIEDSITTRLAEYHIVVEQVSITDFDFTEDFNRSIERKQVAEQDALTATKKVAQVEAEALQKKAFAEGEKYQLIELANGKAEAIRIEGDAEAYRLQVIKAQLSGDLLTLEQIKAWNGVFPYFFSGSGESPNVLLGIDKP